MTPFSLSSRKILRPWKQKLKPLELKESEDGYDAAFIML
jgi:hypothetical protein